MKKNLSLLITVLIICFQASAQIPAPPTYSGTTTICTGQNTTITAIGEGGATFAWWDAPTGGNLLSSVSSYTTLVFGASGTYNYYVDQTNNGFVSSRTHVIVTVNLTPVISVSGFPLSMCIGQSSDLTASGADTYQWTPVGLTGTTITVSPVATSTYSVIGNTLGCVSNTANITVTVFDINAITDKTICDGTSTTLATSGADTYVWNPGGLTGSSIVVSPSTTTTYTVTGTQSATGCTSTETVTVNVNPSPVLPTVTPDFSITSGETATLTASEPISTTYSWSTNFGNYGSLTGPTVIVKPTTTTTYSVVSKTALNCSSPPSPIVVTVNQIPEGLGTTAICGGSSTTLTAIGGGPFTWYNAQTGGTLLFTGAAYTTPPLSTSASYWVSDNGSPRKEYKVFVFEGATNVTSSPSSVCPGSSSNLSADVVGGQINWFTAPTGGTSIGTTFSGSNLTVTPGTTTTYYAEGQSGQGTTTFNYTGGLQTWTVPDGVTSVEIDAYGADGGNDYGSGGTGTGGNGGRVQATLNVTPGEVLNIYVGKRGVSQYNGPATFNGGGSGSSSGGGASDIRIGGTALTDRVIVAGGGGGAEICCNDFGVGGVGGGLVGGNATGTGTLSQKGKGGSQTSGGGAGYQPSSHGGWGYGGGGTIYASGGGGGWYGGGGASDIRGGGGGSSYTDPSRTHNVIHDQGVRDGFGLVYVRYGSSCTAARVPVTVTVINDVAAPVADVASLSNVTDQCSVATLTAPTATDNCAGPITATNNATFPITAQGTTMVTWTYDDGNGNTSTQSQNVVIADVTAPVADAASLSNVTAECSVATLSAPTATDNCVGSITATHNATLPITTQGTTMVTWTYDDGHGNTSTQTQNVVINDITAPIADLASLSTITDECSVSALTAPTATDNCVGSITATHNASLPITTQGTTVVTWTYDDGHGNVSTQTQDVVINDVTTPVADLLSLSTITDDCSVATLTAPTATDNCSGSLTGSHNVSLPITAQGTTVVTWTYNDGNGNTSTQLQNVVITDVISPVADLALLADVTSECSVATLTAPTATDNCVGSIAGTHNATLPITTQGTTVVTWTYDDGNGNSSTQAQNVVIADVTAPVGDVATLADVTEECSVVTLTAPTATDNCAGSIAGTHNATLPITSQGTTVVTWTYDDGNGNTSTQLQNVVVADVTAPVADVATLADVTDCFEATATAPTATDNCTGASVGTPDVSFPITTPGTTVVTWTYDDGNGNTSTQTQNVIVNSVDNNITQSGSLLTADASGASYQWLDCDNGNAIISGETNQSYSPMVTGNFAVEVTENGCIDTSACFLVDFTGIDDLTSAKLTLYPNPSNDGYVNIQFEGTISAVLLYDMLGRVIEVPFNVEQGLLDASSLEAGKYMLSINSNEGTFMAQLIIVK
ncbi:MAG: glycine-rich protein [Crocinitomicaceae bacterium]|nr:glycine-rich protein [Crocinitomicaceae bacterium]